MPTLPSEHLSKKELTPSQIAHFESYSKGILARMFAISQGRGMNWSKEVEKKGVQFSRNIPTNSRSNTNISEVMCTCKFSGSFEEISRIYMTGNSEIYKRVMKKLNPKMTDAVVLHSVVESTPENPTRYIAIKWFSVQSSTPMVANRDFCCIECLDTLLDSTGNPVLIRVMQSIDLEECPSFEKSHGLIRAKIRAGFIYREDPNDSTIIHAQHLAKLDPCGFFPKQWAIKAAKSEVFSSIVQVRKLLERQRINIYSFINKSSWVPNNYRDHCHVCSKLFSTFLRPRHHCRACGDLVCGKCSVFREIDLPSMKTQLRVCVICSMGLRRGNGDDISETASQCSRYSFLSTNSCKFSLFDGANSVHDYIHQHSNYMHYSPSARSVQSVQCTSDTRRRNRGFISVRSSVYDGPEKNGGLANSRTVKNGIFQGLDGGKNDLSLSLNNSLHVSSGNLLHGSSVLSPTHSNCSSAPLPIDLGYLQEQCKKNEQNTRGTGSQKTYCKRTLSSYGNDLISSNNKPPKSCPQIQVQKQFKSQYSVLGKKIDSHSHFNPTHDTVTKVLQTGPLHAEKICNKASTCLEGETFHGENNMDSGEDMDLGDHSTTHPNTYRNPNPSSHCIPNQHQNSTFTNQTPATPLSLHPNSFIKLHPQELNLHSLHTQQNKLVHAYES